jgi:hypothetical protein
MRRVMIDIETLGTTPNGVIASIGAVEFGADRRNLHVRIKLDQRGRVIDADTLQFWLGQSKEAQEELTGEPRVDLRSALSQLREMTEQADEVWAKPPQFDLSILRNAYIGLGQNCPWQHRKERDLRTLSMLLPFVQQPPNSLKHNALADAVAQADWVLEIERVLRERGAI